MKKHVDVILESYAGLDNQKVLSVVDVFILRWLSLYYTLQQICRDQNVFHTKGCASQS